jgi:hypothetical protein
MGARLEDVAGTIHAHPTLGEAVQETALRALGHALQSIVRSTTSKRCFSSAIFCSNHRSHA